MSPSTPMSKMTKSAPKPLVEAQQQSSSQQYHQDHHQLQYRQNQFSQGRQLQRFEPRQPPVLDKTVSRVSCGLYALGQAIRLSPNTIPRQHIKDLNAAIGDEDGVSTKAKAKELLQMDCNRRWNENEQFLHSELASYVIDSLHKIESLKPVALMMFYFRRRFQLILRDDKWEKSPTPTEDRKAVLSFSSEDADQGPQYIFSKSLRPKTRKKFEIQGFPSLIIVTGTKMISKKTMEESFQIKAEEPRVTYELVSLCLVTSTNENVTFTKQGESSWTKCSFDSTGEMKMEHGVKQAQVAKLAYSQSITWMWIYCQSMSDQIELLQSSRSRKAPSKLGPVSGRPNSRESLVSSAPVPPIASSRQSQQDDAIWSRMSKGEQMRRIAESLREQLLCPISGDVMTEPVVASDGNTYDLTTFLRMIQDRVVSPLTNEELKPMYLRNRSIQDLCEKYGPFLDLE